MYILERLLGVFKPQEITVELQYEVLKKVCHIIFGEAYAKDFCSLTRTERTNMFMRNEQATQKWLDQFDDTIAYMLLKGGIFEKRCHRELTSDYFVNYCLKNKYSKKEILQCYEDTVLMIKNKITDVMTVFELPEDKDITNEEWVNMIRMISQRAMRAELDILKDQIDSLNVLDKGVA